MTAEQITYKIESYLQDNLQGVYVEATPESLTAIQTYKLLAPDKCVLVWYDSTSEFLDLSRRFESGFVGKNDRIYETIKIVVSIGCRYLGEIYPEKFELDPLVESVKNLLINYDFDGILVPLSPLSISRIAVDVEQVYWRQFFIDTQIELNISVH